MKHGRAEAVEKDRWRSDSTPKPCAFEEQEEPQGQPEQGRKEHGVVIASVHQMTGPIVVVARSCFLGRMFMGSVLPCRARVHSGAEVKRPKDAVTQK